MEHHCEATCVGCAHDIDAAKAVGNTVRALRKPVVVTMTDRPYCAFTVGMEELHGKPELLLLCDDLGDPMEGGRVLEQVSELVIGGATTNGYIAGTPFLLERAPRRIMAAVRGTMASTTRFYKGGKYRVSIVKRPRPEPQPSNSTRVADKQVSQE